MGAKRSARKSRHHGNVVQFQQFLPNKQKDVKIIPRNKNQEADSLANLAINKWGKTPYSSDLELFDIPIVEGLNLS